MTLDRCIKILKELLSSETGHKESMLDGHGAALKTAIEHLTETFQPIGDAAARVVDKLRGGRE
jgi:hypothetical protein